MFTWNCQGRLVEWDQPRVMGILNVTPDSFFAGSRKNEESAWLETVSRFVKEGAFIVDIGGQSTRPGSDKLDENTELDRVIPAISAIHQAFPDLLLSVDTFYARVAREAVKAGASLVNDVSAGQLDPEMILTVAGLQAPYVLMHMPGTPRDMQSRTDYGQFGPALMDFFRGKIRELIDAGVKDILIDPGFGFGKTPEQNFELISLIPALRSFGFPVLLGVSRKSTIYKTLGTGPEEALNGTTVLHTAGLLKGADLLRVHDVKEATEAIMLTRPFMKKPAF